MSSIETQNISIFVNGDAVSVPAGSSVADLLNQLEMHSRALAVEINQEIQPRDQHAERTLLTNDNLEIVTLAGGG